MRHYTSSLLVFAALTLTAVAAHAQEPTPPPAPNEVPLDGFSALLLAAGAGYGAYKVKGRKKDG
jgi:hypothetical protein